MEPLPAGAFRPSGPWCFAVSQPLARTLLWSTLKAWELHFGAGFLSVQKATLGIGACLLGAASVFQCHSSGPWCLLSRNRLPQVQASDTGPALFHWDVLQRRPVLSLCCF